MRIKKRNIKKIAAISLFSAGMVLVSTNTVEASTESVSRIQGANRFETAAQISQESYEQANTVIIANAREFADALAGVPLAFQHQSPILLAQGKGLNAATVAEIERLGAEEAIILGGETAVSPEVNKALQTLGLNTKRIAGDNRFETASKIADELSQFIVSDTAVVVDGFEFADAMSIAPFAAQAGMPIYLTRTNSLSNPASLAEFDQSYIIGGETAVSRTVENQLNNPTRLAGDNRYETNIKVLNYFGVNSDQLFVSTGLDFVDALTGSVLAANQNSGVALVRNGVRPDLAELMKSKEIALSIFGGDAAVSKAVENELLSFIKPVVPPGEANLVDTVIGASDAEKYNLAVNGVSWETMSEMEDLSQSELERLANSVDRSKLAQEMTKLLNAHRASIGVGELQYESDFDEGSQLIVNALADYGYIAPDGSSGHTLPNGQRTRTAFSEELQNRRGGENLAMTHVSNNPYEMVSERYMAELYFDMWLNSEGHRMNMENDRNTGFSFAVQTVTNGNTKMGTRDSNGNFVITGQLDPMFGIGQIGVMTLVANW